MRIFLVAFVLMFAKVSFGQLDPFTTMFWNTKQFYNPAFTGLNYKHHGVAMYRNQWDGFDGAPKTIIGGYAISIEKLHGGLGINFVNDRRGFDNSSGFEINYSYQMQIKENQTLSIGVSSGLLYSELEGAKLNPIDPGDPNIPTTTVSKTEYNADLGVVYKLNKLTLGLSATHLVTANLSDAYSTHPPAHFYLYGDYKIHMSRWFYFKPLLLIGTNTSSTFLKAGFIAKVKERYWAGLSHGTNKDISFYGGIDVKGKFRVGYAYDRIQSRIADYSNGSHEIVLSFFTMGKMDQ